MSSANGFKVLGAPEGPLRAQVVVVGSGPGGAITAAILAEAGRDVLLIEEGKFLQLDSCEAFSLDEMIQKYRNGGITPAVGPATVAYVEGKCVGGGSEINSGLYHRTPPNIRERWQKEFKVEGLDDADIEQHFEACERDVFVSLLPGKASEASLKLHDGALKKDWKSMEVPRWYQYDKGAKLATDGKRKSMTRTFIPRFLEAGGRMLPQTRIDKLHRETNGWRVTGTHADGTPVEINAETVFSCGGAIQTPALLLRSGIDNNIGRSLQLHPTVKVTARFDDVVNTPGMGVPVHQVKEFSPALSFGCSISSLPYIQLAMTDHPTHMHEVESNWEKMGIYYGMITSDSVGSIRPVPGFKDPWVSYKLNAGDMRLLADGIRKLCEMLFETGAKALFPSVRGIEPIWTPDNLSRIPATLPFGRTNLMTIHLFSSCPMGENLRRCATNSFGRVHQQKDLYISDASLICTAPGVNPQGSVMAYARRNALKFLGKL
ncbi:MAG: choline dehydrogenase-like flavoprotein [Limisphaerales bacterium]